MLNNSWENLFNTWTFTGTFSTFLKSLFANCFLSLDAKGSRKAYKNLLVAFVLLCWEHYSPPTHTLVVCRRELWWHLFSGASVRRAGCQPSHWGSLCEAQEVQTLEWGNVALCGAEGLQPEHSCHRGDKHNCPAARRKYFSNKKASFGEIILYLISPPE